MLLYTSPYPCLLLFICPTLLLYTSPPPGAPGLTDSAPYAASGRENGQTATGKEPWAVQSSTRFHQVQSAEQITDSALEEVPGGGASSVPGSPALQREQGVR